MDSRLRLLDSPGIVFSGDESEAGRVLKHCVRVELVQDLITPIELILQKCPTKTLMTIYNIADFSQTGEKGKMDKPDIIFNVIKDAHYFL